MIRFTEAKDTIEVLAETRGYSVYLDNDSLIELAKGAAARRQRFVEAVRRNATLLFSWANAVEVAGPQGASADAVRTFLDDIGPHWVPLEFNPWKVTRKEAEGLTSGVAVSELFMNAYFHERVSQMFLDGARPPESQSSDFFRLGSVLEWVQHNRDRVRSYGNELDDAWRTRLRQLNTEYQGNAAALDQLLPPGDFASRPAAYVLVHLQRLLLLESRSYHFAPHDGLDFCHTVMAAAYGSVIALDKGWKRRVQCLPGAANLARTYYRPELDELVGVLESLCSS